MTDVTEPAVWTNWSGRMAVREGRLVHVRSEGDAAAVAAGAVADGSTLRVSGAGHSHAPLVPNETIVDVSALAGIISVDTDTDTDTDDTDTGGDTGPTVTVGAGTPIYALGPALHRHGLALRNQGDIDRQFIGGAVATGTHGTGTTLGSLSTAVLGARIATAAGDLVDCSAQVEPELWEAVRLNLGALGVVTRLTLSVRNAYKLRERGERSSYAELAPRLRDLAGASRHFEFFWYPVRDLAVVKVIDETDDEPEYPLAAEGSRVGWNYEVLPSHRTWPHTEMEYSGPADRGPECLEAIRMMLAADFPTMNWPVEYRTLAADEVWLSTAHQRPTVTISLHLPVGDDERPMYGAAEEIFRAHDGRPHWGKVNYVDGDGFAASYPRWADWWRVRDSVDPDGVFLNDYLRSIRP